MSLTSALYSGVSGLLANGESMNVIGNNISNVNTVGFKGARSLFSDLLSEDAGDGSQVGKGVQLQTVQNLFTQGSSQTSENVTDVAIEGNSFFALMAPGSTVPTTPQQAFLTRAGAFRVDSNLTLVNPDGYQVMGSDGKAIVFPADFGKVTNIDAKGIITYLASDGVTQKYYNGNGAAGLATSSTPTIGLSAITVSDPTGLSKVGGSLYQSTVNAGVAATWAKANGSSEKVISNSLEQSNVDMASEFVRMIVTQRAYSANSKTITTTDAMTQEVLNMIR